jgi:N-acetylglucosamine-6-phosphate deacetylase
MVTHLFNAMSGFHHRELGVPGLLGRRSKGMLKPLTDPDNKFLLHSPLLRTPQRSKPLLSTSPLKSRPSSPDDPSRDAAAALSSPPTSVSVVGADQIVSAGAPLPFRFTAFPDTPIDRPYYGLIVDGVHNHPYAVNVAVTSHYDGLVLVTDAMQAMGLPVGQHKIGEMSVDIFHGSGDGHYDGLHAVLSGTTTLAGAVVPLDKCLRNLRAQTTCSIAQTLATVTSHAAAVLGLDGVIGTLQAGARADFVILNDDLEVQQTYIAGQLAFSAWKPSAHGNEADRAT